MCSARLPYAASGCRRRAAPRRASCRNRAPATLRGARRRRQREEERSSQDAARRGAGAAAEAAVIAAALQKEWVQNSRYCAVQYCTVLYIHIRIRIQTACRRAEQSTASRNAARWHRKCRGVASRRVAYGAVTFSALRCAVQCTLSTCASRRQCARLMMGQRQRQRQ